MIADAESILKIAGMDTYLHVGCGHSTLIHELLKRGIDAYGIDPSEEIIAKHAQYAPERFFQGSLTQFPFKQVQFGTVIIGAELFSFHREDLLTVFHFLQSIAKNNLILYFPKETLAEYQYRHELLSRLFWEKLAIHAEFRRHPRSMLVVPYEELENEHLDKFIFFETIPARARERYTVEWLQKNRDLHMDMQREAGRRADGHISRYIYAASKIRPNDIVLDAACGLGYGTAVLAACSPGSRFMGVDIDPDSIAYAEINYATNPTISYKVCDVANLSFIPDHSIDTVISFETIEHVPDYEVFLAEINRILKPDGRFIGSVPNLWCDETGKDPNPYHFHVFDWNKLNNAVAQYFIVEERVAQTAGGGYKLWDRKRSMKVLTCDERAEVESEWWLISASANPLAQPTIPYTNPFYPTQSKPIAAHIDFGKYYDNPWLYRVMVQLGERLSDKKVLIQFCTKIAQEARIGSPDQGAALCVLCYQSLESGQVYDEDVSILITYINAFDAAYDPTNIHAYRWAISLHYIGGRLLLALGKHEEALAAFLSCADMDPLVFSPLLATKTISARMYASLLLYHMQQQEQAKQQLKSAIQLAHQVLQGNWKSILGTLEQPLPFGLQEAAELLDIASQCAQMLDGLERKNATPGYLWEKINLKRFGLVEWNKSLERENAQLREQLASSPARGSNPAHETSSATAAFLS